MKKKTELYKIIKNAPMPGAGKQYGRFPIRDMKVNDSFIAKGGDRKVIYSHAYLLKKKGVIDKKATFRIFRIENDLIQVFRIK